MSDLKEFLDKNSFCDHIDDYGDHQHKTNAYECNKSLINRNDLGMFFWDRGGKQFVEFDTNYHSKALTFEVIVRSADSFAYHTDDGEKVRWAKDFLDALDCLGEEKVKELIGELK